MVVSCGSLISIRSSHHFSPSVHHLFANVLGCFLFFMAWQIQNGADRHCLPISSNLTKHENKSPHQMPGLTTWHQQRRGKIFDPTVQQPSPIRPSEEIAAVSEQSKTYSTSPGLRPGYRHYVSKPSHKDPENHLSTAATLFKQPAPSSSNQPTILKERRKK